MNLAQIGRHDRQLELHRFYVVNGKRLIVGGIDYQFGTFDSLNLLVPFKYGTSDAEYELEQYEVTKEDTDVYERRELPNVPPLPISLYIDFLCPIIRATCCPSRMPENNTMWWHQWIEMLFAVMDERDRITDVYCAAYRPVCVRAFHRGEHQLI